MLSLSRPSVNEEIQIELIWLCARLSKRVLSAF